MTTKVNRWQKAKPLHILVVTPFDIPGWRWLEDYFDASNFVWHFHGAPLLSKGRSHLLFHSLRTVGMSKKYDLVISHGPWLTLLLALTMKIACINTPHMAFTFNHGNKLFFTGVFLFIAHRILPKMDLFVTYSESERYMLSEMYKIPLYKMAFSHWAVKRPKVLSQVLPPYIDKDIPYACCIGRNNRDFETFIKALDGLTINGVVICRKGQVNTDNIPNNVIVKTDLPLDDCMQILNGSMVSVTPLKDNSTGAGHMTIVAAMLLGIPQIITEMPVIEDYFRDGIHGLFVKQGSIESMRSAIQVLIDKPELRTSFASKSHSFAEKWLNEAAAARSLKHILDHFVANKKLPVYPPFWIDWKKENDAR